MKDASTIPLSVAPTTVTAAEPRENTAGFWSLIITQFQGAFSDNLYRVLALFTFLGLAMPEHPWLTPNLRIAVVGALFSLPFILFSMAGGYLADRYSKRAVTVGTKVAEILIMSVACWALWTREPVLLLATIFLMGAQSAFFGPSKYGLLPELLPTKRLSWGNGIIELGTFLAIITGTIAGGIVFEQMEGSPEGGGVVLVALAVVGAITSLGIRRVPPANPGRRFHWNPAAELIERLALIRRDRILLLAVLGNTYFFFIAALIQQSNLLPFGTGFLGLSEGQVTWYLMTPVAVGIGLGSLAAGYLSGNKIEYGLIPLGALGMCLAGLALALVEPDLTRSVLLLAGYGFAGGFFIVPVTALIQHRPDKILKGAVIASGNLLSFVGIFLAAGIFFGLTDGLGLDARQIFLVTSVLTLAGTVYALRLLPDALLRFLLWIATHTFYRIRVEGRDNIPTKGGALLVSNHLSLLDALLVQACTGRTVRFLMFKDIFERRWIRPFARLMRAIPISSRQRPREMIQALSAAADAIREGDLVCIFAEGQITRIGQLLPFRRGLERIMRDLEAPIIPLCLDGVWGSIFSFERQRFLWKMPRRIPYPVTVIFGHPMPSSSSPAQIRRVVQDLCAQAWIARRDRMQPLAVTLIRTARRHPRLMAMADARLPQVSFASALTRSVLLAGRLRPFWEGDEHAGILLPPSVGGALVNWAAFLLGKVPVNLNYTASTTILEACMKQAGIHTVISSRLFLDKLKLTVPGRVVFMEDLIQQPRFVEKLRALALAWLLPAHRLQRALGCRRLPRLDDLATIIFSSGSTGDPKGVMLTHYNVLSNVEQLEQVLACDRRDRILGVLPFFHSFGFTGTLCLPAVVGTGVVFHPTPLEPEAIGDLIRRYAATFLLATPTFLQLYLRGCDPEDFGSLRFILAGAEKLPDRLAFAFEEKFGIRPLEGYGCTECAPAVTVNTRDFRGPGLRQVGAKRGKIGHPLPGISVRIVDPATLEPRPVHEPGLLLVRGPNVMKGYLGRPDLTAQAFQDGWYITGDIAAEDEDGFIQITDRLSRFSKLGGEMVPHIRIEEKLHELAKVTEQTFVVTGLPDDKKGEKLVVLHTLATDRLPAVIEQLGRSDLPNLWIPRANQFFAVPAFPLLGSGKLDLRAIRTLAIHLTSASEPVGA
jgi:acyl-[acyl-carrier-protein]-phospholipid O-acyltransferase / long-chain-fatty-acid--[acyl-carrier-protein] ligase